ncbi:hypothetical protein LguiA_017748 [Lonicera macranthoides]
MAEIRSVHPNNLFQRAQIQPIPNLKSSQLVRTRAMESIKYTHLDPSTILR